MKKEQFISAFSNPVGLSGIQLDSLTELVEQYPYSGLLRMLYVRALKNEDDIRFESELRLAAAHIPVRKKLQRWLQSTQEVSQVQVIEENVKHAEKIEEVKVDSVAEIQHGAQDLQLDEDPQLAELQKQYLTEAIQSSLDMEIEASALGSAIEQAVEEPIADEEAIKEEQAFEIEENEEPGSFLDFISGAAHAARPRVEIAQKESSLDSRVDQIIDGFIQKEQKEKADFFDPERMAKASLVDNEEMVTDTLARIYMNQGNYEKALRAYRSLQLKNPEKRVYFAARIEKAEGLLNKRNR